MKTKKNPVCKALCLLLISIGCLTGCQPAEEAVLSGSSSEVSESAVASSGSAVASSGSAVASSGSAEEEFILFEPDPNMPIGEIPQPDGLLPSGTPKEVDEAGQKDPVYEEGKVTLIRVQIDGPTETVDVRDAAAKEQIRGYVDGMQESSYNAENTPPGRGHIISVDIHRNGVVEGYSFSDEIKENNALAKDHQAQDRKKWMIASKDAFPFLLSQFDS